MDTKNWKMLGNHAALEKADVRPWFQHGMLAGQYFFFNETSTGRVLCLGTCPSTSLAFSYAAVFTVPKRWS